jgi:hypothetical protein
MIDSYRAIKRRKISPELAARRQRALELRLEGCRYADIARAVGLKSAGVPTAWLPPP